ncbi:SOS response-associated peptidase [Candidatus Nomurabacteria bacterium]|nr:SOS response-associated peptidase [Candidatus Nomurabacteria bacterium]
MKRFVLGSSIDAIRDYFNVRAIVPKDWTPPIVVSPGDYTLILTQIDPANLMLSSFGLTPSWAKQPMQILHARAEGDKNLGNDPGFRGSKAIFLKPAFQKPLFSQRCIVVADAYIEWSEDDLHAPYLVFLSHQERPIGLAGLYDVWRDLATGDYLHSFSIITVPANSMLRKIGASRMPVILTRGKEVRWLNPANSLSEMLNMLNIFPSKLMNAFPVSEEVAHIGPFNKDILQPKGERLTKVQEKVIISRNGHYHKKKSDVSHWLGNTPI